MIHDTFDGQLSQRCYEDIVVNHVTSIFAASDIFEDEHYSLMNVNPIPGVGGLQRLQKYKDAPGSSTGASTLSIEFFKVTRENEICWDPKIFLKLRGKDQDYTFQYSNDFIEFVADKYIDFTQATDDIPPSYKKEEYPNLRFRTEYRKHDETGSSLIFRCHPNYRGGIVEEDKEKKPWFDWCFAMFETDIDSNHTTPYCFRIAMFAEYDVDNNKHSQIDAIGEVASHVSQPSTLLTHSFVLETKPGKRHKNGIVGIRKKKYHVIDVAVIDRICLCLPSYGENDEKWHHYTLILPVEEWSNIFTGTWNANSSTKVDTPDTGIHFTKKEKILQ
jgi:hypothetical protein